MADNINDPSLNQDLLRAKGNRPAENARQATPASLLAQMNWQGGETAQDFLGLNDDPQALPPSAAPRAAPHASTPRAVAQAGESSWLMDENPQTQRELNAREEPLEPLDVEDGSEEGTLRAPAVLDASWSEPREPRGSSKRPLVAAFAGLAIVAAAGLAFMKLNSGSAKPSGNEATLASAAAPVAEKPKPVAPTEIEIPKAPAGAAAGAASKSTPSSARVLLDRSGRAAPIAASEPGDTPEPPPVAATPPAREPRAKPKFVPAPAPAAAQPKPDSTTNIAVSPEPAPSAAAPAEAPALSTPPAGSVAQIAQAAAASLPEAQPLPPSDAAPVGAPATAEVEPPAKPAPILIAKAPDADAPPVPAAVAPEVLPAPPLSDGGASGTDSVVSILPQAPPASVDAATTAPTTAPIAAPSAAPIAAPKVPSVIEAPGVRVVGSSSSSLGEVLNARPAIDEQRDAVPTQAPGVTAAPAAGPGTEAGGSAAAQAPATANRQGTLDDRDVLVPPALANGVRAAQAKEKSSFWDGSEVPMEHIATKPKLLTPLVGEVRVKLKTKDVFEGRLYAIGENAVWLEGPYGRMSLDNARIASVEKIVVPGSGAAGKGSVPTLSERVRVKTPGGLVFGKVVSKEEGKVTLLTDAGLTLTVEAAAVETLSSGGPALVIKKEAPKN